MKNRNSTKKPGWNVKRTAKNVIIIISITQFIWFDSMLAKLDLSAIAADFSKFIFFSVLRDLGVTLDQELTLEA